MNRVLVAASFLFFLSSTLLSQITIDWTELPHDIGDSTHHWIANGMVPVDVGDPGGPQTWTFDTSDSGFLELRHIEDVATSPFAAHFPTANLLHVDNAPDDTTFVYNMLSSSEMIWLGMAGFINDTPVVMVYNPPAQMLALPLQMGTTWQGYGACADTVSPQNYTLLEYYYDNVVDAYGTLNIPMESLASFPTLRVNSLNRFIFTVVVNGSIVMSDTSDYRGYNWFIEDYGSAVCAQAASGDTSSNFTQADCFTVLVDANLAGIEERGTIEIPVVEMIVMPSPFRSHTTLEFTVREPGRYRIEIQDISGRVVVDLFDGMLSEGHTTLDWVGRDERGQDVAPGVYFAVLISNFGLRCAKVLRVR
jgi:hypothetical protein